MIIFLTFIQFALFISHLLMNCLIFIIIVFGIVSLLVSLYLILKAIFIMDLKEGMGLVTFVFIVILLSLMIFLMINDCSDDKFIFLSLFIIICPYLIKSYFY